MKGYCSGLKMRFCASIFSGLIGWQSWCTHVDPTCLEDKAGLDQIWCEDWSIDNRLKDERVGEGSVVSSISSQSPKKLVPVPDVWDVGLILISSFTHILISPIENLFQYLMFGMSACSMLYFLCLPTIPTTKPSFTN